MVRIIKQDAIVRKCGAARYLFRSAEMG
jgi:hypothetical protein